MQLGQLVIYGQFSLLVRRLSRSVDGLSFEKKVDIREKRRSSRTRRPELFAILYGLPPFYLLDLFPRLDEYDGETFIRENDRLLYHFSPPAFACNFSLHFLSLAFFW